MNDSEKDCKCAVCNMSRNGIDILNSYKYYHEKIYTQYNFDQKILKSREEIKESIKGKELEKMDKLIDKNLHLEEGVFIRNIIIIALSLIIFLIILHKMFE